MKRLLATLALGGSLLGGIAVPLTAQAAYADKGGVPHFPEKAQQALTRNGSIDNHASGICIFLPSGLIVCDR